MLKNFVAQEEIPLIKIWAISWSLHCDTFCWSYTKSGLYTIKFGYWMARNILKPREDVVYTKPSITKLELLLSQDMLLSWSLNHFYMQCDNICMRCGEPDESVTHAIFECPPALQAWTLATTPSHPNIFPVSIIYTKMDYLFWHKNSIYWRSGAG